MQKLVNNHQRYYNASWRLSSHLQNDGPNKPVPLLDAYMYCGYLFRFRISDSES